MSNKKGRISLKWSFFTIAFIPLIILVFVLSFVGTSFVRNNVKKDIQKEMENLSYIIKYNFETMYPGDYKVVENPEIYFFKGDHQFNSDFDYIDRMSVISGYDISVCYLNSAVITTLKDENGNRRVGLNFNDIVLSDTFESGNSVFYDNVNIGKDIYYSYYSPIKNSNGEIIGMINIIQKKSDATKGANAIIWLIIGIAFGGSAIALIVSYSFSKRQINTIQKIKSYLKKISEGEFNAELDYSVSIRKDELGLMGESAQAAGYSLKKMVQEDQLTSLYNRRFAYKHIDKTIRKYIYQGVKYYIALGDIDFFKKVNDTYGHDAGDKVLVEVSHTIKEFMRTRGYAIRWGGEEILIVFDKQNAPYGEVIDELEELLNKIRALEIISDDNLIKVSMTMGLVPFDPSDKDIAKLDKDDIDKNIRKKIDEYIGLADEKLYYGKQNGRNQLVFDLPLTNEDENTTKED